VLDAVPRDLAHPARVGADAQVVDLSVVIPAYNEQARIGRTIEAVCAYLTGTGVSWELIVVDDGSSDGTAAVAREIMERDARVRLIQLPANRGKGNAVRVGVLATHGTEVLITDADLSTPIDEVEKLRAEGGDAVVTIGSRQRGAQIDVQQNAARRLLGRLGNYYIRAVAVPGVRDTQCGFKLLRGEAARTLLARTRLNGWGIDVEILHLADRFGWEVAEVPVRWAHATGSKLRPTAYLHVLAEVAYVRLVHRKASAA